ncbi:MAG: hypothetical protein HY900_36935 [Deltaproteobacteria bacterium]|nr:hypothetical protein [Deltaproteobacteria bacterium]
MVRPVWDGTNGWKEAGGYAVSKKDDEELLGLLLMPKAPLRALELVAPAIHDVVNSCAYRIAVGWAVLAQRGSPTRGATRLRRNAPPYAQVQMRKQL